MLRFISDLGFIGDLAKSYFAEELLERIAVLLGVNELVAFGPANVKFASFIPNEVWVDVVRVERQQLSIDDNNDG
jgi:hypothetical protein